MMQIYDNAAPIWPIGWQEQVQYVDSPPSPLHTHPIPPLEKPRAHGDGSVGRIGPDPTQGEYFGLAFN